MSEDKKPNFIDQLQQVTKKSVAKANRVDLLLARLKEEEPSNYEALVAALSNHEITHASITRTIRNCWGYEAVTSTSVREYRTKNGLV